ncbi:MAG: nuclear transport factor 2 family protein [Myxococcales bacterium]|nr:nuclear transport factor 2 family protein [Myxococcales bacterium]
MSGDARDASALLARIEALERRLDEVEGVQAIHRLKARYGEVTDRRYAGDGLVPPERLAPLAREIAQLFTEDAVWDGGPQLGRVVGRAAIEAHFRTSQLHFAWHFFAKPQIQVDGDVGHGTWDILAPCTARNGRAHWMVGVEHDRYRRVDGRWLHAYMKLDLVFMAPFDEGWAKRVKRG